MIRLAYNPTDRPQPADGDGRMLDGRSWGPVDTTADPVAAAVDAGLIGIIDLDPDATPNRHARAAAERAAELEDRRRGLGELRRPDLERLATDAGVADDLDELGEDLDDVRVGELRRRLLHADVDLPRPASSSARRRAAAEETPADTAAGTATEEAPKP